MFSGLDPFRLLIDLINPLSRIASLFSAPSASNTAPLSSVATPNAGNGLIRALPHSANAVGSSGGGGCPISRCTLLSKAAASTVSPGWPDFRLVLATTSTLSYVV